MESIFLKASLIEEIFLKASLIEEQQQQKKNDTLICRNGKTARYNWLTSQTSFYSK